MSHRGSLQSLESSVDVLATAFDEAVGEHPYDARLAAFDERWWSLGGWGTGASLIISRMIGGVMIGYSPVNFREIRRDEPIDDNARELTEEQAGVERDGSPGSLGSIDWPVVTSAEEHDAAVAKAFAAEPPLGDDRPEVVGVLQRLCRAAARDLPASGVGVSLVTERGDVLTAAASGSVSELVEELQFTFGEGPCIAAFTSRLPVLVPDLLEAADTTWPAYGPAALEHGVRAVFAFPLKVGRARLGVLDIYQEQVGRLPSWTVSRALTYADAATRTIVESDRDPQELAALLADSSVGRLEVYQAQGMVMAQLGVSAADALLRIRAYAFLEGLAIGEVATEILARRLHLERDGR